MIQRRREEFPPVVFPVHERGLLIDEPTLRVIHRMMYRIGWYSSWGETEFDTLGKRLNEHFKGDDDHLTRT